MIKINGNFGNEQSFHSFAADFEAMEVQERIVQKAYDLFMRYGIRSVSMDEIASQLGMSKKTIYQFFADKDALVNNVIDIVISKSVEESRIHRERSENAVQEIFMATEMFIDVFNTMNPTIIYDLQKYHPAAYKKIDDYRNNFLFRMVRENLEKGIENQLYRPEINTDIISRFRLASIFSVFNPEYYPLGKFQLSTIVDELTVQFMCGITTAKGRRMVERYLLKRRNKKD